MTMLGNLRTTARLAALAGLLAAGLALLPPTPASAGGTVLTVTTTDDVVDGGDGVLSLREAVHQASADAGVSAIALAATDEYPLEDCSGVNEDGQLILENEQAVTLDGNGSSIVQGCEDVGVMRTAGDVVLEDISVRSAAEQPGTLLEGGDLELDGVTVTGGYGNISAVLGDHVEISDSTFDEVEAIGTSGAMIWAETVELVDSTITDSTVDIGIQGGVHATDVEIVGNSFDDTLMLPINQLVLDGVIVRDNDGMPAGMVLGGAHDSEPQPTVEPFVVRDSVFVGNEMTTVIPSEECCPVLGFGDVEAEVTGTSIVGNIGFRFGIATYQNEPETPLEDLLVENSTVGPQGTPMEAAIRGLDEVTLRHVSVGSNSLEVDDSAEIRAATLDALGVLVGGDGDSCDVGSTTSHGGNADRDGTCGFDQANDRPDEPDLSDGYTVPDETAAMPVWLPTALAEGVDLIPAEDCLPALGFDQIGRERPQGSGCDAGSVELLQPFSDVPPGHPFFDDVAWASSEGIAGGFEDGTYRPSAPVSRQAMAAFLYRMAGEPPLTPPSPPTFSDVGPGNPFRTEVEWLADSGIAGGFADGTFRPSNAVSRQAMAAFLYRRALEPPFTPPSPPTFSDVGAGNPFRSEIEWLVEEGIADGYEDGTYRPTTPVSRQAMAAFLHRVAED
jgi:hypothetical protein